MWSETLFCTTKLNTHHLDSLKAHHGTRSFQSTKASLTSHIQLSLTWSPKHLGLCLGLGCGSFSQAG